MKGTSYGDELLVSTTNGLGVVRTLLPTEKDIKATSITCGGKIVDAGEGDIEERGVLLTTQKRMRMLMNILVQWKRILSIWKLQI